MCPMHLGRTGLRTVEKSGKRPFQGPQSMWQFYPGPIESLTAGPLTFLPSQGVRQIPAWGCLRMFPTAPHPRTRFGGEEPPACAPICGVKCGLEHRSLWCAVWWVSGVHPTCAVALHICCALPRPFPHAWHKHMTPHPPTVPRRHVHTFASICGPCRALWAHTTHTVAFLRFRCSQYV